MNIFVLGREKELCLTELEASTGDIRLINDEIAESKNEISIDKLGGSIKTGEIIYSGVSNLAKLQSCIIEHIAKSDFKSKFSFGLSYYGKTKINLGPIGIKIKKELKNSGLKPRLVIAKEDNKLNAASVKHNKLIEKGFEFIIIQNNSSMDIAVCTGVQDIDSYSKRDYDKPCRDRKVGMLPPKLSQIMINLTRPKPSTLIVDPFCGSGGLLIEASLMGYESEGSDISEEMITCSKKNVEWFNDNFKRTRAIKINSAKDATQLKYPKQSYNIATEGFLGTNFLSKPTKQLVTEQLPELKKLYLDFFKNLLNQETMPNSICICFPFWKFQDGTLQLNLIDEISNLGYTISEFKSVRQGILSYHREGQFTGRQIVVFKPNKEK